MKVFSKVQSNIPKFVTLKMLSFSVFSFMSFLRFLIAFKLLLHFCLSSEVAIHKSSEDLEKGEPVLNIFKLFVY